MAVQIKRVYEASAPDDGFRVLVDRLWPRGVSKDKAQLDLWLKEAGPSNELRQWFGHDPAKFKEFGSRYCKELDANPVTQDLKHLINKHKIVTLVYSAKDPEHNQAAVLKEYLSRQ